MHVLGRFLQVVGLILLPVGLLYGVESGKANALTVELTTLAVGALAFFLGTKIAGRKP